MSEDRRKHERLAHPIEGSWRGASGATRCRISDVSLNGCFLQSLASPSPGETTNVSIEFDPDHPIVVEGKVAYTEAGMGFAVEFVNVDEQTTAALGAAIQALKERPKGD